MGSTESDFTTEQLVGIAGELLCAVADLIDNFDDEHNHILNETLVKHLEEHPELFDEKSRKLIEKSVELEAEYQSIKESGKQKPAPKTPTARVSSGGSGEMNEEDMWECEHAERVMGELEKLQGKLNDEKSEWSSMSSKFSTMSSGLSSAGSVIAAAAPQIILLPSHGLGGAQAGLSEASSAASQLASSCSSQSGIAGAKAGIIADLIEDWAKYKEDQYTHAADVVAVEPVPFIPKPISGWDIIDPYDWVAGQVEPTIEPFIPPIVVGMTSPSPIIMGPNVTEIPDDYIANEEYEPPKMEFLGGGSIFWEPEGGAAVSAEVKAAVFEKLENFIMMPDIKLKFNMDEFVASIKEMAVDKIEIPGEMLETFMNTASDLMKDVPDKKTMEKLLKEFLKKKAGELP